MAPVDRAQRLSSRAPRLTRVGDEAYIDRQVPLQTPELGHI